MKRLNFFKYLSTVIMVVVGSYFIPTYASFDSSVNLAIGKTATARDSRSFDGYGTNPSFVTDNSMTTHWCAQWDGAGNGSWIYIDLQNYYMVNKVIIEWRGSRWPNGAWKLQVATNQPDGSGNSNWADVYTGNAGTGVVSGAGTYEFTATAGRYVRMLGMAQSNGYGYNIYEMRVYANDNATPQGAATSLAVSPSTKTLMVGQQFQFESLLSAANGIPMSVSYTPTWGVQESSGATINGTSGIFKATQTGTFTVTCNTTYESQPFNASATVTVIPFDATQNLALNKTATTSGATASNGNDGSLTTRWRSSNANQQEWWQVDLGVNYVVNNVTIKMNGDAGARGATYNILASLTGLEGSWQTVVTSAQIPTGSGTEYNSHAIASVPARYIKYSGLTRGGWDHNFAEFEVKAAGFYYETAAAVFTSVAFNNASVIANEEVALTISALDEENNPFLNASITGIEITEGTSGGVTFEQRSSVWYARGLTEGTYTLRATGVDNGNGSNVKTGTASFTVTEARRVASINISKAQDSPNKYAAGRAIPITVSCVDQYNAAIVPTINWDIQGVTGSVTGNDFTATSIGTAVIKATSQTSLGTVESSTLSFDIITKATNIAKNKNVSSISGATGGSNAVDENSGSQWIVPHVADVNNVYNAWLVIDLEADYIIDLIEVIWEGAYSKTFTIDYSANGVDFTTKYNGSNSGGTITKYNKFYTNPSMARYVRIYSTEAGSGYGTKILDVYINGVDASAANYYRSTGSGNWADVASWQTSTNNIDWTPAVVAPSTHAGSIEIESGQTITLTENLSASDLIVKPGGKLTLNSTKTLTANSLTLNSDASGTATFVDNGTATITTATVQQYFASARNWYMSSPVAGATVPTGQTYFSYDESGSNTGFTGSATAYWVAVPEGTEINPMKGYIAQPGAAITKSFTGTLNTGVKTVALTRTNSATKPGFNLVANPYPSYLDWQLVDTTAAHIHSSVWYRTKTSGGSYTFDTYNGKLNVATGNGENTVTKLIPPMQAFWVRVKNGFTSGTLTFDNSMRKHVDNVGNKFKAPAASDTKVVRLKVSNGTNSDEALLCFNADASNNFDAYDSPKMFNNLPLLPEVYTLAGNEKVVINGMNTVQNEVEIPIGFTTSTATDFTLKSTEMQNFDAGTKIILIDKLNPGIETDLTDGAAYNFSAQATAPTTDRFSLKFRIAGASTDMKNPAKPTVQVFVNVANQISIVASEKCNYAIYNAVGQKMLDGTAASKKTVINNLFEAGVYIVKVSENGKELTTRIIIK